MRRLGAKIAATRFGRLQSFFVHSAACFKDKALLKQLVEAERRNEAEQLVDWRLNMVLSNDAVFRSLTPIVELRVKNLHVEMSVETLSDLRFEVARAIHRLKHYQY